MPLVEVYGKHALKDPAVQGGVLSMIGSNLPPVLLLLLAIYLSASVYAVRTVWVYRRLRVKNLPPWEEGALDVYTIPGTMKKGRPGHVLTVLCQPGTEQNLARAVLRHTTTLGLRVRRCEKYFLHPGSKRVDTPWGAVPVKTGEGFGIAKAKPEYEGVAELADKHGLPYQTVYQAVLKGL